MWTVDLAHVPSFLCFGRQVAFVIGVGPEMPVASHSSNNLKRLS